jgi:predicted NACHT family NTPase
LADGAENAAVVCCFLTPDYEECINCKFELQYAQKRRKKIIPCLVSDTTIWKPSDWLQLVIAGLTCIEFDDITDSDIDYKTMELMYYIQEQSSVPKHLSSTTVDKPSYLFELIRYEYQRNSRIERIMNPAKSFPIEQSYVNLAIVKAKEQYEKEKQLRNVQHNEAVMDTFEEIYGMKTAIDIKDIFETCKNQEKQVLVFGRAGIGKSTFCRYIAYKWATGSYWSQYELLVLVPLRRLTTNRYLPLQPGQNYSLIDLVKKEFFPDDMSEKDKKLLENQFDAKKTLWILDGYDEIIQNVPPHLTCLFEQLLKTPHHILTSRPYLNTLSYDVQMEITGFTDENIEQYVQQFFNQMKAELDDASIKSQTLLNFLRSNQSIWGVAHIPVNLELICSLWSNEDWSETKDITITALYSMITEWLCRRYLRTQNNQILQLSEDEIDQRCQKELAFLESLAFSAMEDNTIIIRPILLKKALNETQVSSQEHPHILNIGILKSFNKQGTGIQIEKSKDHYFVHLSFQEYFAARYLVNSLKGSSTEKIIEFIKHQKYNQRYALVFTFASGILSKIDGKSATNIFWDVILGDPLISLA